MKLFLNESQITQLIGLSSSNYRDNALLHVALSTGLRASDLVRLDKINVLDSDGAVSRALRVKMQKTGSYVDRPLRDDCREAIAKYLEYRKDEEDCLFASLGHAHKNYRLHRVDISRIFRKYLSTMFPESIRRGNAAHTLRRSVARLISEKSGRAEPASKWLGHKSISSTMTYIDNGFEEKANEVLAGLNW